MRRRENAELKMKIYFDTCVYCRPFDDQSQERISEEIIKLAKSIEDKCGITGADALHIASSAETKYFITCDDFILLKDECITNFMKKRGYSVEVIGITKFMEDKKIWK